MLLEAKFVLAELMLQNEDPEGASKLLKSSKKMFEKFEPSTSVERLAYSVRNDCLLAACEGLLGNPASKSEGIDLCML
jgi:hypothetical protein